MISPTQAVQAAERGLRAIDPVHNPDVAAAHAAGHAGIPLLVTRLDATDGNYYLVPWEDSRGILLVVQVDALGGEMSSAAAFPQPLARLVISPNEARRIVETQLSKPVIGEPKLVWQPSRESASPLQPLYHVVVEGGEAFVGAAGTVYRSLSPFGHGG